MDSSLTMTRSIDSSIYDDVSTLSRNLTLATKDFEETARATDNIDPYTQLSSDKIYDDVVWTPFYRTIPDIVSSGCTEEPIHNYGPYQLFALNTRLSAWLHRHWNPKILIEFPSVDRSNRMYVTIFPTIGGSQFHMTPEMVKSLQQQVDKLTSKPLTAALLISSNNFLSKSGDLIPSSWIDSILPYMGVNPVLNPHLNNDGILVELNKTIDFTAVYRSLIINVTETLRSMFEDGYIVGPPSDVIDNWNLIPSDESRRLFYPDWKDNRITDRYGGMFGFIKSRVMGEKYIDLKIGTNLVHRHNIAKKLSDQHFNSTFVKQYVRVEVNNLPDTLRILNIITRCIRTDVGKVVPIFVTRSSWIFLLFRAASELGFNDVAGYNTNEPDRPYVFSCIVDFGTNVNHTTSILYDRAREIALELGKDNQNMRMHDAIEIGLVQM